MAWRVPSRSVGRAASARLHAHERDRAGRAERAERPAGGSLEARHDAVLREDVEALPVRTERQAPHGDTVEVACLRSEEHTSELQSRRDLVCRLLLEKKKKT